MKNRWVCPVCNRINSNVVLCNCGTTLIQVGDNVWDDLTATVAEVLEILIDKQSNVGFRLDSEHLEGLRYAWEVQELPEQE